jgi:hypothetical protein
MDRNELSEHVAISDFEPGLTASVLEILGFESHASVRKNAVALADSGIATDLRPGTYLRILSHRYLRPDDRIGTHPHGGCEIGLWIDDGGRVNQGPHLSPVLLSRPMIQALMP